MTGIAGAIAGIAMRATQPAGSCAKLGSAPDAGSTCSIDENSKIMRTASQKGGVAIAAIENNADNLVGPFVSIHGGNNAEDGRKNHRDNQAHKRKLQRNRQCLRNAIGDRCVVGAIGARSP